MKSKNYWETEAAGFDPFQLPRRVSQGLNELVHSYTGAEPPPVVRYLWIYVTEDGIRRRRSNLQESGTLRVEDWLNVIDESAALGAEWMVIHAGASLCQCPEVWKLCEWAQHEHGLRVGLHLSSASLSEDDVERLTHLDRSTTYIIADAPVLAALRPLRDLGMQFCDATVTAEERKASCTNPKELVCVGIDGRLFTCGLVLGDEDYAFGSVLDRGLKKTLQDTNLPHAIHDTTPFAEHGCDGCPPHVAHRITGQLAK
jgi:hypothetical protein